MKQLTIVGNVGKAPQTRTIANGKDIMSFSVAVNSKNGVDWFGIVSNDLPKIREYIVPGRQVLVQGRPDFKVYNNVPDITIYADNIELLGKGSEDGAPDPSEFQDRQD